MIDPVWIAFGSGVLIGAALLAIVLAVRIAVREWREDRRAARGNAQVIDLATARLARRKESP